MCPIYQSDQSQYPDAPAAHWLEWRMQRSGSPRICARLIPAGGMLCTAERLIVTIAAHYIPTYSMRAADLLAAQIDSHF